MNWKEFDDTVLKPFEKKGDHACDFCRDVTVFSYSQIRYIALKAFEAGANSMKGPPE
jgi:hypothetical protein